MAGSSRRRSTRSLIALGLALSADSRGAVAFVHSSAFSLHQGSAPSSSGSRPLIQRHVAQRRQPDQARIPTRFCFTWTPRDSQALASALSEGHGYPDDMDGWSPIDGIETGTVSLVGSGPGDPDLLTIAGLRELQSADLVISDRLVSKEIQGMVRLLSAQN